MEKEKSIKAKIRMIGFLLFFIINLCVLLYSFISNYRINNLNNMHIKYIISIYFFILYILFSIKLKKIKTIIFIIIFFILSLLTKSLFLALKLQTLNFDNIIKLTNYNYYLNLLNSFFFSFISIYLFNILNLDKKIKILLIPQIILKNLKIRKEELRKLQISKYVARIIYESFKEYKKLIN